MVQNFPVLPLYSDEAVPAALYRPRKFTSGTRYKFYRDRRTRWVRHLGGKMSHPQQAMVEHAVELEWNIRRIEDRYERSGKLTQHSKNELAAWRRHYREAVRWLGAGGVTKPTVQSLDEVMRGSNAKSMAAAP